MVLTPRAAERAARVRYEVRGRVAVLTLDGPPVNSLSHALRAGLLAAVYKAQDDTTTDAIVITGSRRAFSAGGDVREFGTPSQIRSPRQVAIMEALSSSPKPVVAAISGVCLGGGLELAMACHLRVVAEDAILGLPEITLGLLPGGGGCQLLPRLLGLPAAADMILSGDKRSALTFRDTALVDQLVEGDPVRAAVEAARYVVARGLPLRRTDELAVPPFDLQAWEHECERRRALAPDDPAVGRCIDAISLAPRLAFNEGQLLERKLLLELMAGPESLARRHLFAAERRFPHVLGSDGGLADTEYVRRARARLATADGLARDAARIAATPARDTPDRLRIAALANEGARMLQEGVVRHAAEVDLICVHGLGFPRLHGGAMLQADIAQLPLVVRTLQLQARVESLHAPFWQPAPLLIRLADEGGALAIQEALTFEATSPA